MGLKSNRSPACKRVQDIARNAPYNKLILSPATIAICILLLKTGVSPSAARKKKSGRKGKKKPTMTPLNNVPYISPVAANDNINQLKS